MKNRLFDGVRHVRDQAVRLCTGPQVLVFVPALTLGGYWLAGEGAMVFCALVLPALFAVTGLISGTGPAWSKARDQETGLMLRQRAEQMLSETLLASPETGRTTAAIAIEIDDFSRLEQELGTREASKLFRQAANRVVENVRENDMVVRLGPNRIGMALGPMRRLDLEGMIQLAARLQGELTHPFSLGAARVFVTASAGFCLPGRAPARNGPAMIDCAELALDEAIHSGPGTIRAYSPDMQSRQAERDKLVAHCQSAVEAGAICPWFEPQLFLPTGELSALHFTTRWAPDGPDAPMKAIPTDQIDSDHGRDLFVMGLGLALQQLQCWDAGDIYVPQLVNRLDTRALCDPRLVEQVAFQLDRFDMPGARLRFEVAEGALKRLQPPAIARLTGLVELGCQIDLCEVGRAKIEMQDLRALPLARLKVDRSLLARLDRDPDQQALVLGILKMAEELGWELAADGVDTESELDKFAELGGEIAQGLALGAPLDGADATAWMLANSQPLPLRATAY